MTNAELLAKIREEIERRRSLLTQHSKLTYDLILEVFIKEYDDLLSFLSTLESEKPMQDGLEEEIQRFLSNATKMDKGEWKGKYPISEMGFGVVARHFAQCGAEHEKEELMKKAVEGEVMLNPYPTICLDDCKDYDFKDGDKVRIIIVKEN